MREYSFVFNGRKYPSGSILKIKSNDSVTGKEIVKTAYFNCVIPEKNIYMMQLDGQKFSCPKDYFYKILIEAIDNVNKSIANNFQAEESRIYTKKPKTFKDELNIDGLLIAWIWYIFVMAVAIIFKDVIGIWILASIVFFSYRNKKLRKAGFKK